MEGFSLVTKSSFLPPQVHHHQWRSHSHSNLKLTTPHSITTRTKTAPLTSLYLHSLTPPMLKALSSSCLRGRFTASALPSCVRLNSPARRVVASLNDSNRRSPNLCRRFFCSDSSDGSDPIETVAESKQVEVEGGEAESKASSAIVPTVFRPEDYLTVSFIYYTYIFINLLCV